MILYKEIKMKNILIVALLVVFGGLFAESMFDMTMQEISKDYIKVQKILAADKTEGVNEIAGNMLKKAGKLDAKKAKGEHASKYAKMPEQLKESTMSLKKAKNIKSMRKAFGEMSKPMAMWTSLNKPADTYVVYCPMAKKSWLQDNEDVANPYYGSEMLKCGEVVSSPADAKMMKHDLKHDLKHDMKHDMKKEMKHHMGKDMDHKCDGNCKHDEKMMKHEMKDHKCDENCKHDEMMMKHKKETNKSVDKKMDKLKGKI